MCTSGVTTPEEILEKRWTGVEGHSECSEVDIPDLIRILLGKSSVEVASINAFRKKFKDADAGFFMSDNELELKVLSGSVLGLILSEPGELADQAALALLVANGFKKDLVWCRPFTSLAATYLAERLRSLRSRKQTTFTVPATKTIKSSFETLATSLASNTYAESGVAANKIGDALITHFTSFGRLISSAVASLEFECNLRREESDILWWMTSGVSRDFNQPFSVLQQLSSSIIAGKELADLVSPPGILPYRALLLSVIPQGTGSKPPKTITVKASVNSIDDKWRESVSALVADAGIADLCPILSSIKQSLNGSTWENLVKKESDFNPALKFEPVEIATQAYLEFLLLKSFD
jgi:hypothetical protein